MLTIGVEIKGFQSIRKLMEYLGYNKPLLEQWAEVLKQEFRNSIDTQTSIDGSSYAPLARSTIEKKKRMGYSRPEDRMIASGKTMNEAFIVTLYRRQVGVGIKAEFEDIVKYNNDIRSFFFGMSEQLRNKLIGKFYQYINDSIKKAKQ